MRLRRYVIPSLSLALSAIILGTGVQVYETLKVEEETLIPVVEQKEITIPTMEEESLALGELFTNEEVTPIVTYYEKESSKEAQENSLIYYESYYMPNTGVLYGANEQFDVFSVYDGMVMDVKEDALMGQIVVVEYGKKLTCLYAGLEDVKVTIGSSIIKGELIGTSKVNTLTQDKKYMFHLEVNYKGNTMDPEKLYTMDVNELISNE